MNCPPRWNQSTVIFFRILNSATIGNLNFYIAERVSYEAFRIKTHQIIIVLQTFSEEQINLKMVYISMWSLNFASDILTDLAGFESHSFATR